jgi:ParB family chromosome partitioning protein
MAGLGRGLSSLLSESKKYKEEKIVEPELNKKEDREQGGVADGRIVDIEISKLEPSIYQPRKAFDEESISELAHSISEHGLLEPLLVQENSEGKYSIICGERRFRACKIANVSKIPCIVRTNLQNKAYAIALIENIQRENLNPLELAHALELMLNECKLSQEDLAKTLGKSRSSISNILRLRNLHPEVQELVASEAIDLGHAKVLLGLKTELQPQAAKIVVKKGLNVRQTEIFVENIKAEKNDKEDEVLPFRPKEYETWEKSLSTRLNGVKVKFSGKNADNGKLTLSYSSHEQLDELLKQLGLHQ